MFRIFLTNLGKYNEGELVGKWIDLPVYDDFADAFRSIEINEQYEEWFITDYESDLCISVGEYDNIYELNEMAEELDCLGSYDKEIIDALLSYGYDFEEALSCKDNVIVYWNCSDMTDVAEEYCEQYGILDMIPEGLQMYFDYEKYGRDMNCYGTFIHHNGNYYEVLR